MTKSKSKSKPSLAADNAIPFDFVFRSLWIKSPKSRTLNRKLKIEINKSYHLQNRSNGEREEREREKQMGETGIILLAGGQRRERERAA